MIGCGGEQETAPAPDVPTDVEFEAMDVRARSEARDAAARATGRTYRVAVRSDSGITFTVTRSGDGSVERECAPAGLRGCSADGTW